MRHARASALRRRVQGACDVVCAGPKLSLEETRDEVQGLLERVEDDMLSDPSFATLSPSQRRNACEGLERFRVPPMNANPQPKREMWGRAFR